MVSGLEVDFIITMILQVYDFESINLLWRYTPNFDITVIRVKRSPETTRKVVVLRCGARTMVFMEFCCDDKGFFFLDCSTSTKCNIAIDPPPALTFNVPAV